MLDPAQQNNNDNKNSVTSEYKSTDHIIYPYNVPTYNNVTIWQNYVGVQRANEALTRDTENVTELVCINFPIPKEIMLTEARKKD